MLLRFYHCGVHLYSALLMQIFSWLSGLCYYGDDMEGFVYDSLIVMLLVSRSGLVEENAVEVFHY